MSGAEGLGGGAQGAGGWCAVIGISRQAPPEPSLPQAASHSPCTVHSSAGHWQRLPLLPSSPVLLTNHQSICPPRSAHPAGGVARHAERARRPRVDDGEQGPQGCPHLRLHPGAMKQPRNEAACIGYLATDGEGPSTAGRPMDCPPAPGGRAAEQPLC